MADKTKTQKLGEQCAAPFVAPNERGPHGEGISQGYADPGLTKREQFAAMAMQGFLSKTGPAGSYEYHAHHALLAADALLAEFTKEQAT